MTVLIIAGVCALTVVVMAFLMDAHRSSQRRSILRSAPDSPGVDLDAPTYVLPEDVRARPEPPTGGVGPEDPENVASILAGATRLPIGFASRDFITDPAAGRVVLRSPVVLVAEDIRRVVDLAPVLAAARDQKTGLVVVARSMAEDLVETLGLNARAGRLRCLCVICDDLDVVAGLAGAQVVPASDLMAGFVPAGALGHVRGWVCDADTSQIQPDAGR